MTKINLWAQESFEYEYEDGLLLVNGQEISPAMLIHTLEFGLRQMIRDAGAGEKEDDKRNAAAFKKIDALIAGTLRQGTGGGKRMDPVERRAREIAMRKVEAAVFAKKLGWTRKAMQDHADALYKRDAEKLHNEAIAELAATTETSEDILADLGL